MGPFQPNPFSESMMSSGTDTEPPSSRVPSPGALQTPTGGHRGPPPQHQGNGRCSTAPRAPIPTKQAWRRTAAGARAVLGAAGIHRTAADGETVQR